MGDAVTAGAAVVVAAGGAVVVAAGAVETAGIAGAAGIDGTEGVIVATGVPATAVVVIACVGSDTAGVVVTGVDTVGAAVGVCTTGGNTGGGTCKSELLLCARAVCKVTIATDAKIKIILFIYFTSYGLGLALELAVFGVS